MRTPNPKSYRKLPAWQEAKKVVLKIYQALENFPKEEIYGLSSQIKRAAISVASNIAEGNQRRTKADRISVFGIAQGSLDIAMSLRFSDKKKYEEILELINKSGFLLTRFIDSEARRNDLINPSKT